MTKVNKRIADLVEFASKPRTMGELADLHLPNFTWTRQGIFKRLRKLGVRRRPRTKEGRSGFDFFDLPDFWQMAIIQHFISKTQNEHFDQKKIDAILYAASAIDARFALEWNRREKHLDAVHKKIFDLIVTCGERRDI